MRTIKFRGRSGNLWAYGNLYIVEHEEYGDSAYIIEASSTTMVDISTIGQFTGLCDINGKEIYEGDIVYSEFEDGSNGSSLVGWNEKQSCFGVMDEYAYRSKLEGFEYPEFQNRIMLAFMRDAKQFEVIGNIYDNPELLETRVTSLEMFKRRYKS